MRLLLALVALLGLSLPAWAQTYAAQWPKAYSPTQTGDTAKIRSMAKGDAGNAPTLVSPGAQGKPSHPMYAAKVIARFNAIQHRTITDPEHIGVLAWHACGGEDFNGDYPDDGIAYVDFQVDDGPIQRVQRRLKRTSPPWNPHSLGQDYWVTLNPSRLDDGAHNLRAVVVPHIGQPRVLDFAFVTNAGGSLTNIGTFYVDESGGNDSTGDGSSGNPWQTIAGALQGMDGISGFQDGGWTIELQPGSYTMSKGSSTVCACTTGQSCLIVGNGAEGAVKIDETNGTHAAPKTRLLHLKNVTIEDGDLKLDDTDYFYLEQSVIRGSDAGQFSVVPPGTGWFYNPDDAGVGFYGVESYWNKQAFRNAQTILHCYAWYTADDPLSPNACLVSNSIFEDVGNHGAISTFGFHPDFINLRGPTGSGQWDANFIAYQTKCYETQTQAYYVGGNTAYSSQVQNVAVVSCLMESSDQGSQFEKSCFHNVTLQNTLDQSFRWRCHDNAAFHWSGNLIKSFAVAGPDHPACATPTATSVANSGTWGVNGIFDSHPVPLNPPNLLNGGAVLAPAFTDQAGFDYSLTLGSPVQNAVRSIQLYDIDGNARASSTALGCYKGANE